MITNPKHFYEQFQNFIEEAALKIKAINGSISSFLTKADAESTYLKKTEASNTYLGKSEPASRATVADSATSADKATKDANGDNIANTYLKATVAQSTYLSKTEASSTYLTKSDASSTYLGKTAKAASASNADSATKATQDGNGNNIANTYATIASLTITNTNVTNAQTTANQAKTSADASLKSKQDVLNALGYTPLGSAPVTSVDGQTGAVDLSETYQPKGDYVASVNGMTGAVTIDMSGTGAYQIPYATCTASSTTLDKLATITNGVSFSLVAGALVAVKFTKGISGGKISTLNVNSTGAKTVMIITGGSANTNHDYQSEGDTYVFVYDGTNWNVVTMLAYRYSEDSGD
jgi:hypothetical protein